MIQYPITYEVSFFILWGIILIWQYSAVDLLGIALVGSALIILLSHERAHVNACIRRNLTINSLKFTWLGGFLDADVKKASDYVVVLKAGIFDTSKYMIGLSGIVLFIWFLRDIVRPIGVNFAPTTGYNVFIALTQFTIILFIGNILPISFYSKKFGDIITTDGWAAWKYRNHGDALIN